MSKSSQQIKAFVVRLNRAVSVYELRSVGGFTQKQIHRAVRDGILSFRRNGDLDLPEDKK